MDAIELAKASFVELDGPRGQLDCIFWLEVIVDLKEEREDLILSVAFELFYEVVGLVATWSRSLVLRFVLHPFLRWVSPKWYFFRLYGPGILQNFDQFHNFILYACAWFCFVSTA